jgi:hypothetical protein
MEHWKQMQNNLNAQLRDGLQDKGDEHIIFDVLIEQLGENLDEARKSRGGSKPRHRPKVERGKEVGHIRIFVISLQCGLFTMINFSNIIFKCIEDCFSILWKQ